MRLIFSFCRWRSDCYWGLRLYRCLLTIVGEMVDRLSSILSAIRLQFRPGELMGDSRLITLLSRS